MEFFQNDTILLRLVLAAVFSSLTIIIGVMFILNWRHYFIRKQIVYSVVSDKVDKLDFSKKLNITYENEILENSRLYMIVIQKFGYHPFLNQKFGIILPKESTILEFESYELDDKGEKISSEVTILKSYPYALTGQYKELVDEKLYFLKLLVNQNEEDSLLLKFPKNEKFRFNVVSYHDGLYLQKQNSIFFVWFYIILLVAALIMGIFFNQPIWSYLYLFFIFISFILLSKRPSHFTLRHSRKVWKKGKQKKKK